MAFTEKYVTTTGAGSHDGTTEGNAWSFAEAIAAAPGAGIRVNVKSDAAYSVGAVTFTAGTAVAPAVWRGYEATIGDLDANGRNADGTLNITNFPAITITGAWVPAEFLVFQNLNITGALSSALIVLNSVDSVVFSNCKIENTQNNAGAKCLYLDDSLQLLCCDISCTGAAHGALVDCDSFATVIGCRFHPTAASPCVAPNSGVFINNVFDGGSVGVDFQVSSVAHFLIARNTFYNCSVAAIQFPAGACACFPVIYSNHVTDCALYINNLYSGTADWAVLEHTNRTRDNGVAPRTGILSAVLADEVTTDTGGIATDCVDAAADNFFLIPTAPGRGAGMMPNTDIGALQRPKLTIPAAGDVEVDSGAYGEVGYTTTPTFAVPLEADVELDVQYGAGGTEFTGTLAAAGLVSHSGMRGGFING